MTATIHFTLAAGAAIVLVALPDSTFGQPTFETLPCSPTAVSADGSAVVGGRFRWTRKEGLLDLGHLPPPYDYGTGATAVSADGSVIVGFTLDEAQSVFRAFRWTQADGIAAIVQDAGSWSIAWGVSSDGNVVVGEAQFGTQAFRWTPPDSTTYLPGTSVARGVSGDGSVIVGYSRSSQGYHQAFRWTAEDGMVGLGGLRPSSVASGVSLDGSTIVGSASDDAGTEAFRHTRDTGMIGLGDLPGDSLFSHASAVAGDGSVIVGYSYTDLAGGRAFIWDATRGMRQLHAVLLNAGLDVAGWTLSEATGISADGRTIVGTGIDPKGQRQGWMVVLGDACPADFNADHAVNSQDFFDFLTAFFAQDPAADFNDDGEVTTGDFFDFLTAFFTPCE